MGSCWGFRPEPSIFFYCRFLCGVNGANPRCSSLGRRPSRGQLSKWVFHFKGRGGQRKICTDSEMQTGEIRLEWKSKTKNKWQHWEAAWLVRRQWQQVFMEWWWFWVWPRTESLNAPTWCEHNLKMLLGKTDWKINYFRIMGRWKQWAGSKQGKWKRIRLEGGSSHWNKNIVCEWFLQE